MLHSYLIKGNWSPLYKGKVIHVYPSMHAIGIRTPEGLDVLLHIGIDTSQLKGMGFKAVVNEGDQVKPGQLLITFDIPFIRKANKSLATPMVITNSDRVQFLELCSL